MQSPSSGIESVQWSTNSMPAQWSPSNKPTQWSPSNKPSAKWSPSNKLSALWSPSNKPAQWPAADQSSADQPLDLTTAHQTDVTESPAVNSNTAGWSIYMLYCYYI